MVEDALHEGEAYLLATQLHRSRIKSHQVEAKLATAHSKAETASLVAAATTKFLTASKVTQETDHGGKTGGGTHSSLSG